MWTIVVGGKPVGTVPLGESLFRAVGIARGNCGPTANVTSATREEIEEEEC